MADITERCPNCDRPYAPDGTAWGDKNLCYIWQHVGARCFPEGSSEDVYPALDCGAHRVNWRDRAIESRKILKEWERAGGRDNTVYAALKTLNGTRLSFQPSTPVCLQEPFHCAVCNRPVAVGVIPPGDPAYCYAPLESHKPLDPKTLGTLGLAPKEPS